MTSLLGPKTVQGKWHRKAGKVMRVRDKARSDAQGAASPETPSVIKTVAGPTASWVDAGGVRRCGATTEPGDDCRDCEQGARCR